MKIGVLTLQGGFAEHMDVLRELGVQPTAVRLPAHLAGLDGLIIPGGESTTIGKIAEAYGLIEPLRDFGQRKAIWGTCAGAILLAKDVGREQLTLRLMDISIARNAFGSQTASFETGLVVPAFCGADGLNRPFPAVFIRAPLIGSVQCDAEVVAALEDGRIVAARQGHWLATAFHPELTKDFRFHQYFLEMVGSANGRVDDISERPGRAAYILH